MAGPSVGEGEHGVRVEAVERADELAPEHLEAVEAPPLLAAKVEIEGAPMRVGIAAVVTEKVEILVPAGAGEPRSDRLGQRPVQSVASGDPEQLGRRFVDEVRQFLDLVVEKAVAGVEGKLALDLAMDAIGKKKLDDKVVQAPIDLYASPDDASRWLATHSDGLP